MTFLDDLHAAQTAPRNYADVPLLINGTLHTMRIRRMDGFDWTAETDLHPMRPGVGIDMKYGYNFRTLTKSAAPQSAVLVVDDDEVAISDDEWEVFFTPGTLSGRDFAALTDAIWALNVRHPELAVEAAKKKLSRTRRSPRPSPRPGAGSPPPVRLGASRVHRTPLRRGRPPRRLHHHP